MSGLALGLGLALALALAPAPAPAPALALAQPKPNSNPSFNSNAQPPSRHQVSQDTPPDSVALKQAMLSLLEDGVQLEQITVTASAARRRLGGEVTAGGVEGGSAAAGGTSRFLTELANTTTAPSAWVVSVQVATEET